MKDSGVEWIGEIPKSWNISKSKYFIKLHSGEPIEKQIEKNDEFPYPIYGGGSLLGYTNKYNVNESNLLIGRVGSAGKITVLKNNAWATDNALIVNHFNIDKSFLAFLLEAMNLQNLSTSNAQPLITSSKVLKQYIAYPDINTQKRIGEKVKKSTEKIDGIIKNTQHSIEELKKYKQSLITEAVTKGLDKNVEMEDSGIEWMGHIPKNWDLTKINRLFSIKKDIANQTGHDVLSVTQSGLKVKDISRNEGQMAADYSKYQIVKPGDFVMNHMDLLTGWVDVATQEGVTSPDYRAFHARNGKLVFSKFYLYVFQVCYMNKIFYGLGQGVSNLGRWRLQTDKFLNFYLPLPSLKEQKEIVEFLDSKLLQINSMLEQKEQLLSELEHYKKSLIYEYVTGKKEV